MSNTLYSNLSRVCHSFYRLHFPHERIASMLDHELKKYNCKNIVFFGGLIYVAKILKEKGYDITFVDYTEEMIVEAKKHLTGIKFVKSDVREFKLSKKFDAILLMGRIFTYMYSDEDCKNALKSLGNNIKETGIIIFDNYETGKIDSNFYFTGTIELKEDNYSLRRISKIKNLKKEPSLYTWDCVYEETKDGKIKTYEDKDHILRSFTKEELKKLIEDSGLHFIKNMENFEKISFVTIAKKK